MSACPERHEDLSALLDGALEADEARALEEHLAGCAGCQAEREALAHLVGQVRALPRRAAPAHFGAAVMARVLELPGADERPELPADVVLLVDDPAAPPPTLAAPAAGSATPSRHVDPFTAPTVPVPAPTAAPRSAVCDLIAEDLSAYVDGELQGEARRRVDAHLASCMACDGDMWALDRQRARVRALPRLAPHELFVRQIMARVEAEELAAADRSRRIAAERAQRARQLGWVVRAASLLAAAALSLNLTAPEEAPPAISLPRPSADVRSPALERQAAAPPPAPVDEPPLGGAFDAVLELRAPQGLDAGFAQAQQVVGRHASLEALRRTEAQRELGVRVPARLVDDLYRDLDALNELDGSPVAARAVDAITAEQDRVVLKNGIVLAGSVVSEAPAAVVIDSGGLRQAIDRRRVERIERADQPRTVRVVITERQ